MRCRQPLPTIEIDVDILDPEDPTVADIVRKALAKHASGKPSMRATAYMYFTPSINFGELTSSEFVMIAGSKSPIQKFLNGLRMLRSCG